MAEKIVCQPLTSEFSGHCPDIFAITVIKLGDLECLTLM
jgi:hypothetical protein